MANQIQGHLENTTMLLHLDQDSRVPLHEQIHAQIAHLINQGTLATGAKLPPSRGLAESLGVNRSTVYRAYQILITNGSQHGFDLILRLLSRPGAAVAMEAPTYSMAIKSCQQQGIPIVAVPLNEDGMDLDVLEKRLRSKDLAFVYTMPNFHNPTGITTGQAHRERLLTLCEAHRVPLVEDGFEEELKYFGHAVLPIKAMDHKGVVIYLGTFSKVVFPGLRVGFIAAHPDCLARLAAISRVCWLSGNILTQAAVSRFCESGAYEDHIRRVHRAYRPRMRALLEGLSQYLPQKRVRFTKPQGGYTLLLTLQPKRKLSENDLMERFLAAKVLLSPGSLYFPTPPKDLCFRISLSNVSVEKIQEGCRRIGLALKEMV